MGDCHYLDGNVKAQKVVQRTKEILDLLGMNPERLRLRWVSASEGVRFAEEIKDFVAYLKRDLEQSREEKLEAKTL
ncbi:MAG: hydrogenase iron-sulfur subunit [Thermodesulforhabdaceae bacterium]